MVNVRVLPEEGDEFEGFFERHATVDDVLHVVCGKLRLASNEYGLCMNKKPMEGSKCLEFYLNADSIDATLELIPAPETPLEALGDDALVSQDPTPAVNDWSEDWDWGNQSHGKTADYHAWQYWRSNCATNKEGDGKWHSQYEQGVGNTSSFTLRIHPRDLTSTPYTWQQVLSFFSEDEQKATKHWEESILAKNVNGGNGDDYGNGGEERPAKYTKRMTKYAATDDCHGSPEYPDDVSMNSISVSACFLQEKIGQSCYGFLLWKSCGVEKIKGNGGFFLKYLVGVGSDSLATELLTTGDSCNVIEEAFKWLCVGDAFEASPISYSIYKGQKRLQTGKNFHVKQIWPPSWLYCPRINFLQLHILPTLPQFACVHLQVTVQSFAEADGEDHFTVISFDASTTEKLVLDVWGSLVADPSFYIEGQTLRIFGGNVDLKWRRVKVSHSSHVSVADVDWVRVPKQLKELPW